MDSLLTNLTIILFPPISTISMSYTHDMLLYTKRRKFIECLGSNKSTFRMVNTLHRIDLMKFSISPISEIYRELKYRALFCV